MRLADSLRKHGEKARPDGKEILTAPGDDIIGSRHEGIADQEQLELLPFLRIYLQLLVVFFDLFGIIGADIEVKRKEILILFVLLNMDGVIVIDEGIPFWHIGKKFGPCIICPMISTVPDLGQFGNSPLAALLDCRTQFAPSDPLANGSGCNLIGLCILLHGQELRFDMQKSKCCFSYEAVNITFIIHATIKELRDIAASINDIANWLTGAFSADTEPEADAAPAPTAKEPEPVLAFEDVRAILADKSHEGFTAQIRELLQKYGASKLSEVDAKHYKALIADVEGLSNG